MQLEAPLRLSLADVDLQQRMLDNVDQKFEINFLGEVAVAKEEKNYFWDLLLDKIYNCCAKITTAWKWSILSLWACWTNVLEALKWSLLVPSLPNLSNYHLRHPLLHQISPRSTIFTSNISQIWSIYPRHCLSLFCHTIQARPTTHPSSPLK